MADVKISAMPAAPDVLDADVFPTVQAGVNFKATRPKFLTGQAGLELTITTGAGGSVAIRSDSGNTAVAVDDNLDTVGIGCVSFGLSVGVPLVNSFNCDPISGFDFMFDAALHFNVLDSAVLNGFTIDAATGTFTIVAVTACVVPYFATTPGDWAGAAPTEVKTALDRCAALLKVLNAGVGP